MRSLFRTFFDEEDTFLGGNKGQGSKTSASIIFFIIE